MVEQKRMIIVEFFLMYLSDMVGLTLVKEMKSMLDPRYLQSSGRSSADIDWFGGNVNCTNLLVWNIGDDCLDIDQGYGGDIDNVIIVPGLSNDHVFEIDGGEGQWNAPFTIDNSEVVSDELEQAHFRADAVGYLSYFGDVNFEVNEGTAVVVNELVSGINHSEFNWTYWYNR